MSVKKYSDTVETLFSSFIRECSLYQKSHSTIENYQNSFKALCRHIDGIENSRIGTINKSLILDYTESLSSTYTSVATVNHYLRDIRAFLYWCMENEYLPQFKIKCVKDTTPLKTPYSKGDIKVLLRKPSPGDGFIEWRGWAIINTVIGCGARSQTLTNMLKQDIDFSNNSIYLRHNKDGRKNNSILLVPQLKKALLSYLRYNPYENDVLFPNIHGEHMTPNGLRGSIEAYNKNRGVNQTSVHLLRHTFGALWAENGGDVYELQRIMTHKDIRTTQNYINMYSDKNKNERSIKFNPLENI